MIVTVHKEFADVFEKVTIARSIAYKAMISASNADYELLYKDYKDLKVSLKILKIAMEDLDRKVVLELISLGDV